MLGSVNGQWETYIIREAKTGEEVIVPARRKGTDGAGLLHKYFIKPDKGPSEEDFRERFDEYGVVRAGSMWDWQGVSQFRRQAFYVKYPGFSKVLVGQGMMASRGPNGDFQVRIVAEDGLVYFLNYPSLRLYTDKKEIP